jgi:hypothetical protein
MRWRFRDRLTKLDGTAKAVVVAIGAERAPVPFVGIGEESMTATSTRPVCDALFQRMFNFLTLQLLLANFPVEKKSWI